MKKFTKKIILFLLPILLYCLFAFFVLPELLKIANGPNTKEQIEYSFKNAMKCNYDMLILGNSRLYRGINPGAFTIKSYNFSHDNDTYNQIYYKLKYLYDQNKKIKYLILGVDYFQFGFITDTRNYVYGNLLGPDYLKDYKSSYIQEIIKRWIHDLKLKKLLNLRPQKSIPYIKENGQYIKTGIAKNNDNVERDISRKIIQVKYFEKIIEFCKERGIKVFIVMMPTRTNELSGYKRNEIIEFNSFLKGYTNNHSVFLLNYSEESSYNINDYTDITHLNEKAADRFSRQLNDAIINLIKR